MDGLQPPLATTVCVLVACLHQQCPFALFLKLELRLLATWRMLKTLWPNGGCQPVPGLSRAESNLVPRFSLSLHECKRNRDDVPVFVLPHRNQQRVLVLSVQECPVHLQHRLQLPPCINTGFERPKHPFELDYARPLACLQSGTTLLPPAWLVAQPPSYPSACHTKLPSYCTPGLRPSAFPAMPSCRRCCGGRCILKSSTTEGPPFNMAFKGKYFQSILNGLLVHEDQPASKIFILLPGANFRDISVVRRPSHVRKIYLRLVWSGPKFSRATAANVAHVDFLVVVGILSFIVIRILLLVVAVLNVVTH
ncbi:uncharacterized protein G2W53_041149 [Senna tora]|uniref:Uncharacterized protein n=1 Tax=Senna tora TaxID=362788 RepID=A0A834VXR3_9FABA|nr:uncharacterized protein G2W53_041149 [Senna tora]